MAQAQTKVIFFGTSQFAVPILQSLIDNHYEICAVITTPDKLTGRKGTLSQSPVALLASAHNFTLLQPEKLKDETFLQLLLGLQADINIVVAYGKFLPTPIINMPRYGTINIHPSLLPYYRGPSPIQSAILDGEAETGTTIMQIDAEMDHGPIVAQEVTIIGASENYLQLSERLAIQSAQLLIKALPAYVSGELQPKPQDHILATFTKMLSIEDGEIKTEQSVKEAYNRIRALNPEPGSYVIIDTHDRPIRLKILEATIGSSVEYSLQNISPGSLFALGTDLGLRLSDGFLVIEQIQPEGKKPMSGKVFLNGYKSLVSASAKVS